MAPYPRILFPYPTNTSDCLSFCSPPCDYYHLCPSDSPPPYSPTTTVIRLHHASHLPLHVIILTAAVLAATLLLLLTWCAVICFRRRRRRGTAAADTISVGGGDGGFFEEGETDHHVWYIRTVGLDESAIEAISMWVYKASDGILGSATADCAVCLGEFQDGEMLRLLPKCGHGFHVACIDTWLRSHVNCPICRAPVVAANANLASPSSSTNEEESSLGSSALPENTQMGLGESVIVTVDGNRIHADPSAEESSSSRHLSESEVLRSIEEEKSQFVRRSVSMDSSSLASLLLRLDLVERCVEESKGRNFEEEKGSKNIGKQGIASKEAPLQQTISLEMECYDMERSLSCSGSTLLLSRYGRARNAILPL